MVEDLGIQKGDVLERDAAQSWFKKNYPLVKPSTVSAHFLKLSTNATSRIHYSVDPKGHDDFLYQIDGKKFRLYDPASDPEPIYIKSSEDIKVEPDTDDQEGISNGQFAYEKDLQNFLAKNLSLIEPGMSLYEEEEIKGIEFPVGNRFIDILAVDSQNNYVVIELKVSRGYDRVVGQILRYMAWIKKHHAEQDQSVRGVIIAREISEDLVLACSEVNNVELYEYNLSIALSKINK
jgi:hypothetical protein